MTILEYKDINREEWSGLVLESATGTWFQTPEAYEFFASMPELFRPFAVGLAYLGDRPVLRAVCVGYVTKEKNPIKQFFTRRAIIIGGPVLADDCTNEEVTALMNAVKNHLSFVHSFTHSLVNSPIYIESRNFNDYSRWKAAFAAAGFDYKAHLNFHVDCTDKEKMWERLSENRKRQIRHSGESGVTKVMIDKMSAAEPLNDESEIREWYNILERLYRTKVKTPLWPVEFFLEAYRQGVGKFMLVKYQDKVIGGSFCVELKRNKSSIINHQSSINTTGVVYEWFECGMNSEYKEQYPSVMATWAGMEYAAKNGYARYDMMGAGEPGVPYGVRDFKAEFGGEEVEQGRFLYIAKPMLYKMGIIGVSFLKKFKHSKTIKSIR